ncbi:PH domain-containing protein [Methanothermobacter thermautotrophicus]|jgi:membrane protein YdbS with pleckstrin-like domain|uniref:PH domain-containing protein n=1 Tax=Methanothermobacter thermautotrophicus TaxID=145262 RepID=A0A842YJI6_METTF|nr:PH domain-containing protein [Methanothermobacter thermautotrophicus]MBE2899652.1 PH domain-containing protein [Methanothermobacter thermautotrophicus]
MFGRDRLHPGERILYETRPRFILNSKSTIIKALSAMIIAYLFQGIVEGAGALDSILIANYGVTVAGKVAWLLTAVIIIILLSILWDVISWKNRRYIITDQRVMVEEGVLRKRRYYINHRKIVDVSFSQSITERLLDSADVEIHGGHEGTNIILRDAPSPSRIEYHISRFTERGYDDAEDILRELSSRRGREPGFADPEFWDTPPDEEECSNHIEAPDKESPSSGSGSLPEGECDESIMERHSRKFKRYRREGRDE